MAIITGSGKWVKIDQGRLSMGIDGNTCSGAAAATYTSGDTTYYGFLDSTTRYINLPQLTEFDLSPGIGYTGTVKMYTTFTCPYQILFSEPDFSQVVANYNTYRFVNGFMVGVV